jgi:hypothetical protein
MAHRFDLLKVADCTALRLRQLVERDFDRLGVVANRITDTFHDSSGEHAVLVGLHQLETGLKDLVLHRRTAAVEDQDFHLPMPHCMAVITATL